VTESGRMNAERAPGKLAEDELALPLLWFIASFEFPFMERLIRTMDNRPS
jgi:hypothetical protein